jgi:hypothetical protein
VALGEALDVAVEWQRLEHEELMMLEANTVLLPSGVNFMGVNNRNRPPDLLTIQNCLRFRFAHFKLGAHFL